VRSSRRLLPRDPDPSRCGRPIRIFGPARCLAGRADRGVGTIPIQRSRGPRNTGMCRTCALPYTHPCADHWITNGAFVRSEAPTALPDTAMFQEGTVRCVEVDCSTTSEHLQHVRTLNSRSIYCPISSPTDVTSSQDVAACHRPAVSLGTGRWWSSQARTGLPDSKPTWMPGIIALL
jgi:hypothetical protein